MRVQQRRIIIINGRQVLVDIGTSDDGKMQAASITINGTTAVGEGLSEVQALKNLQASCKALDSKV